MSRGVGVGGVGGGTGRRSHGTTRDDAVEAQSKHFPDIYLSHYSESTVSHVLHEVMFVL